ncbi:ATP-binding cassette sub-family D member 2 [Portunus trituberculatus]|uniref:ATP-binding cassette sub-family D member 2 n=1 Tax=Portunus trituberculatus TaxID=210409 RepID=A0A5B7CR23_PORTR|nr:ATP-binding cassette sub-family D member 2 [Portunus trituberculatus]
MTFINELSQHNQSSDNLLTAADEWRGSVNIGTMTNAVSKLIRDTSQKLNVSETNLTRGGMSVVVALYIYKVVYPKVREIQLGLTCQEPQEKNREEIIQEKKRGPAVNRDFFMQLRKLMRIIIPGVWSKSAVLLAVHTVTLVTRTFLSIYVAELEGRVVKYIVRKDVAKFALMMTKWIGIAVPATFINSMIRFLESHLALTFRTCLVKYSYDLYFRNQCYYRVSNLDGRLENADHCLTEDITAFTSSIAHLYSHITKPLLDSLLISYSLIALARARGGASLPGRHLTPGSASDRDTPGFSHVSPNQRFSDVAYVFLTILSARKCASDPMTCSKPLLTLTIRATSQVELGILQQGYHSLSRQMNIIFKKRLWYVMLEQFLMKYVWSGAGMVMTSIPLLTSTISESGQADGGVSERTQYFTTAKNMLTSGADAVERLLTSYKEIVELAGYTARVGNMLKVFEEVQRGRYVRVSVMSDNENRDSRCPANLVFQNGVPVINGIVTESPNGTIIINDVPIVTPNCDVVVPSLNLTVHPQMHLLITGGCK